MKTLWEAAGGGQLVKWSSEGVDEVEGRTRSTRAKMGKVRAVECDAQEDDDGKASCTCG